MADDLQTRVKALEDKVEALVVLLATLDNMGETNATEAKGFVSTEPLFTGVLARSQVPHLNRVGEQILERVSWLADRLRSARLRDKK
jgi:hypothetical protein